MRDQVSAALRVRLPEAYLLDECIYGLSLSRQRDNGAVQSAATMAAGHGAAAAMMLMSISSVAPVQITRLS